MTVSTTPDLQTAIAQSNAYACLECGKCTSVCPVSRFGRSYSPRVLLTRAVRNGLETTLLKDDIWACLACGKCEEVCPSAVRYAQLMPVFRATARSLGSEGHCAHAGTIQTLQRLMSADKLEQHRMGWLTDELKIAERGDILYYVGCAPYFDVFFSELEVDTLAATRSSIALLNRLDITPVVLSDERCCGHDLYWNGDMDPFLALATRNVEAIKATGVKTVLFSCAECLSAFKNVYPQYGFEVRADLRHISEFLADKLSSGELGLAESSTDITYHDPCRLGRHSGIYDQPRQLLNGGDTNHFHEMQQNRKGALCCGVSGWMNCDAKAKAMQRERLDQARATGAKTLAVACPKCQIHLTCALREITAENNNDLRISDIATIVLDGMQGE